MVGMLHNISLPFFNHSGVLTARLNGLSDGVDRVTRASVDGRLSLAECSVNLLWLILTL